MLTLHYGSALPPLVTAFLIVDDFGNLIEWDRDLFGVTWPHDKAWTAADAFRETDREDA